MTITIRNIPPEYHAAWQEWGELFGHIAGIGKLTIDPSAKRPKNSAMLYCPHNWREMLYGFGNTAKEFPKSD